MSMVAVPAYSGAANGLRASPARNRRSSFPSNGMPRSVTGPSGAASRAAHRDGAGSEHVAELGRDVALLSQPWQHAATVDDVENQLRQLCDGAGGAGRVVAP